MDDPHGSAARSQNDEPGDGAPMTETAQPDPVILPTLETPTLTKAELADLLFERIGLNKRESKDLVEAFFDLLHESLVQGQEVRAPGPHQSQAHHQAE